MTTPPPALARMTFAFWEMVPAASVRKAFAWFVGGVVAFRLLVLLLLPLDLSGDEAYYWEWGRHLDWGYFSKPPGIAWLMALAGKVGGDTTFGIRLFAVLLGTASLVFVFQLTSRIYGPAPALIAAFTFVANPASAALNLILTIDAPLVFAWTLALWAFWEFIQPQARSGRWGVALFLALVAGLLSKQMMAVFPVLALAHLAVSDGHRAQLRRPALWLCLIGPFAAWLPSVRWNMANDWLTVRHTLHHFEAGAPSLGRRLARFFEFIGSQLGIITPVLFALLVAIVIAIPWRWRQLRDSERFLWWFGGPAILFMLGLGLRQRINPNWPAVFYPSTLILLTGWAAGKWSLQSRSDRWRTGFVPGLKLAVAITAGAYVALAAASFGLLRLPGIDPSARIRGWSQLAREIDVIRRELPDGQSLLLVTQGHRFLTSTLAFYLHDQPRVYIFNSSPNTVASQHDLWETPSAHLGEDALLIVSGEPQQIDPTLAGRFESVQVTRILRHPELRKELRVVTVAIARRLRQWPGPRG